ncbi:MAG: MBL fold metallo-hydrolase [Chitinophaga sp.]|uniref:MBL fold metallo-hydrolase n=1 Tax=Chitinophaga sp. TaxID=1869181 RepID=UPI0025BA02B7|nr:MBL fold metallo-hydrolase [Chitinophaga sp.]MBV8256040.1 MBL fold metallo-hydrolase [Chitinophaga sp.]
MQIEQIYTGCLSQGAYYIESQGEAAIIDPLRETAPYIHRAEKDGAKIKYIFETHFHADFVSGHIDLASKTGATIIYGPTAQPDFKAYIAKDNEEFIVGDLRIIVLHTPGHTMESICLLLKNADGKDIGLFSGDTLFIGDVGRPDLAQKINSDLTQEKLAGHLYESLHHKIMPLADDIIVYPAHGSGSACGKNMSAERTDTLGHQKAVNYALQPISKETFIKEVTTGLMPPPAYFPLNVMMNIHGYESIDNVLKNGLQSLTADAFEEAANATGAIILDTRDPEVFAQAFIPNAINIGLNGSFAPWVGTLVPDITQPILFICDAGREAEVVIRLARVGYDHTIGFLEGGFNSWKIAGKETDNIPVINATALAEEIKTNKEAVIMDVRRSSEHMSEHLMDAINIPLDYINDHLSEINKNTTYFVHCVGGYRSMIFSSILRSRGYTNLVNVTGGFKGIKESGLFTISNYVSPNTML